MQRINPYVLVIGLIVIIAALSQGLLSSPIILLLLAGGGGYLLYLGRQIQGGRTLSSGRVTYWRGRRIELPAERQRGPLSRRGIGPALPYFLVGGVLVVSSMLALVA